MDRCRRAISRSSAWVRAHTTSMIALLTAWRCRCAAAVFTYCSERNGIADHGLCAVSNIASYLVINDFDQSSSEQYSWGDIFGAIHFRKDRAGCIDSSRHRCALHMCLYCLLSLVKTSTGKAARAAGCNGATSGVSWGLRTKATQGEAWG